MLLDALKLQVCLGLALSLAIGLPAEARAPMVQPPRDKMPMADTAAIARKWLDQAYAKVSPAQKLDLFLPDKGEGPFPLVVHIHGGGFMFGDKTDGQLNPVLPALKRGFAVASLNYRLSGEARFPAQIQDVKAAIRWLRAHAADFSLDPTRIAVWGGSAGGHLASLAGTSGGVAALEDLALGCPDQSSSVQAVVDWFGPIDFLSMDDQFRSSGLGRADHGEAQSPESRLLGQKIAETPEKAMAASPATYITPDDPPFFIQHGTKDPLVPTQQSIHFASALEKVLGKGKVCLELLPDAGHGGPAFSTTENTKKVLDFLEHFLK
jgi:acetyl esterase/lipase